jgi:hypothetical protein
MAKFGSNIKMTVAPGLQQQTRAVFEGVLGCERLTVPGKAPNASIDLFAFEDGASIAVDYADDVLTAAQHKAMGTWFELEVADEEVTANALEACEGVVAFSFVTEHRYFHLPGGQVFRLKR